MKSKYILTLVLLFITISANAQFKNYNVKGGIQYQQLIPFSEFSSGYSFIGRGFLDFEVTNSLAIELGVGYGQFKTTDDFNAFDASYTGSKEVSTDIIPIEARLKITPWAKTAKNWNPYFYVGTGLMNYSVKTVPSDSTVATYQEKQSSWTGTIPAGIGTEIKMSKNVLLDISGGATYTFTDLLNNCVVPDFNDASANVSLGLTFTGSDNCNTDEDRDGLTYCREEQLGTNPEIADTDGDGLMDGEEVNTYKTNPLNKDTDGEGLTDGDEVKKYNTNPLNKDTDSDGLNDYEELFTYKTLPTDSDTDDDGLTDGDEVMKYKTNPNLADTDLGSINDGVEVARGTNPLNPDDDLPPAPKKEEVKIGTVIVLEGINFASGSAEISAGSEEILMSALNTMKNNPEIIVEISGHTDSRGTRERNMTLSKDRAESVKIWLVSNGIDGSRIMTEGFGPDQPIATNDTEEGRLKNRRIEFKRIK